MELEEAIEILNNYLCETHRKFCSIGAVGIPNKEYFAIETVLNHITKQEKMIDLMTDELVFGVFDFKSKEQVKQYFEKKAEENK